MRLLDYCIRLIPRPVRDRYRQQWYVFLSDVRQGALKEKIARFFVRPKLPCSSNGRKCVHLGCGHVDHPGFINVDRLLARHIHYNHAIDHLPFFKDMSIDVIYASHCLEHFSHGYVEYVLKEWFRVLKIGGILRLSVPDFDRLLDIYRAANDDINKIILPLFGGQEYVLNYHKTVFTRRTLESSLVKTGFKQVRQWDPFSSSGAVTNDSSTLRLTIGDRQMPISLNLEGVK